MRTFVIGTGTDIGTLRGNLIDGRISASRAEAALARLQALNPHVDLASASPGAVIFVPAGPEFAARATASPVQDAAGELLATVGSALGTAAEELKAGLAERAAERDRLRAAFDSDAFRGAIANDPRLQQQAADAATTLDEEEAADGTAAEELDATGKAALAALADLARLAG